MHKITRRQFMQRALAGLGAVTGAKILAACGIAPQPETTPTAAFTASHTAPPPTAVPPTLTPAAAEPGIVSPAALRPAGIRYFPDAPSLVVQAGHGGVWKAENLDPRALADLLDAAVSSLTGIKDGVQAWASLFKPHEKVAIKVNATTNGYTHVDLATAVGERLAAAGLALENIVLFDRYRFDMEECGFATNVDKPGLRCFGTDGGYIDGWQIGEQKVRLSRILTEADALINLPILKAYTMGGISFALKNHYGTLNVPYELHGQNFNPGIVGLNALDQIQGKTRLVIGDLLTSEAHRDSTSYVVIGDGHSILMSHDPVAMDAVGVSLAEQILTDIGQNPQMVLNQSAGWLKLASEQKLGAGDLKHIERVSVLLD